MPLTITVSDLLAVKLQSEAAVRRISVEQFALEVLGKAVQSDARATASRHRLVLIEKQIAGGLDPAEEAELQELQRQADAVGGNGDEHPLWNRDPLETARLRGDAIGAELLATEGKPLTTAEVSEILHITPGEAEQMRAAGRLLAVDAGRQGFVFPSWQFSNHGVLAGLPDVLEDLRNLSPWTQLQFFLNSNLRLDGASPLAELRRGNVADVRRAARNYGEQGAV